MTKTKYVVSMYDGEDPGNISTSIFDDYKDARSMMISHCGFTKEEIELMESGEFIEGAVLNDDYAGIMCGTLFAEENSIDYDLLAKITEVTFE